MMPTFEHVIYIPAVILLGVIIGYIAGSKAVRAEHARRKQRLKE